jgi:hypothetical protein
MKKLNTCLIHAMRLFCSVQGKANLSTGVNWLVNEDARIGFNAVMGKKGHCPAYFSEAH